jgi:hypothetical protein
MYLTAAGDQGDEARHVPSLGRQLLEGSSAVVSLEDAESHGTASHERPQLVGRLGLTTHCAVRKDDLQVGLIPSDRR